MCRREGLRSGEMELVRERLHHDPARPGAERGGFGAALVQRPSLHFHVQFGERRAYGYNYAPPRSRRQGLRVAVLLPSDLPVLGNHAAGPYACHRQNRTFSKVSPPTTRANLGRSPRPPSGRR
jgi:hypothetical protein